MHAEPNDFKTYVVQEGDTLWKLAGEHWKTIAKVNRISPERLRKGMALRMPHDYAAAEENAPIPRELPGLEGKIILIDIRAQVFGAYNDGALVLWGPISSSAGRLECGRANEKKRKCITPAGNFCVLGKDKDHVSNKYPPPNGGARMKYAVRFYGDYWIHAGALPGRPDSHGCIRVLHDDAQWLFRWTNKKTKIIIVKDPLF